MRRASTAPRPTPSTPRRPGRAWSSRCAPQSSTDPTALPLAGGRTPEASTSHVRVRRALPVQCAARFESAMSSSQSRTTRCVQRRSPTGPRRGERRCTCASRSPRRERARSMALRYRGRVSPRPAKTSIATTTASTQGASQAPRARRTPTSAVPSASRTAHGAPSTACFRARGRAAARAPPNSMPAAFGFERLRRAASACLLARPPARPPAHLPVCFPARAFPPARRPLACLPAASQPAGLAASCLPVCCRYVCLTARMLPFLPVGSSQAYVQ
mmetsp:Transcript_10075/g.20362  ORF Transcript_10075/g.20362 Transcript_10075/m.20362 type:complete len:273 (+) Transcript_10075:1877-2695(+)